MIVADASVLIAWLDEHDPHHRAAIDILASVETFVVDRSTLAEVLVHPVRLGVEDDVLARLLSIGMRTSTTLADPASLARIRHELGVKMPDCVVAECADQHRLPVATFEQRLIAALERTSRPVVASS